MPRFSSTSKCNIVLNPYPQQRHYLKIGWLYELTLKSYFYCKGHSLPKIIYLSTYYNDLKSHKFNPLLNQKTHKSPFQKVKLSTLLSHKNN
jgi:hypothetical protein